MNKEDLHKEVSSNLNKLLLDEDGDIGRLIGYCETSEDYYWIINKTKDGKVIQVHSSCVGSLKYLEDSISIEEYKNIDNEFSKLLIKVDDVLVQDHTKNILVRNRL